MGVNTPYLRGFGSLSGGGYLGQNSTIFQLFHYSILQDRHLYIIKKATAKVASGRSIKLPIRFIYSSYPIVLNRTLALIRASARIESTGISLGEWCGL